MSKGGNLVRGEVTYPLSHPNHPLETGYSERVTLPNFPPNLCFEWVEVTGRKEVKG